MQPPPPTVSTSNEARITIAIKAMKSDASFSQRAAAHAYLVPQATLSYRSNGRASRCDCLPDCRNLTLLEEKTIVERILDLDSRGFHRQRVYYEIWSITWAPTVGINWPDRFIKRTEELQTGWTRSYDDQRKKQEDPEAIGTWFKLVANIKVRYGILDEDTHNFDESGFMMGVIGSQLVVTSGKHLPAFSQHLAAFSSRMRHLRITP
jgi:hypothetical protein